MFVNTNKPSVLVGQVPPDESKSILAIEALDFANFDLRQSDFLVWDSYPWLTDKGFRFILGVVIEASIKHSISSGLTIEAIVDDCSGEAQSSIHRNHWPAPFYERWSALTEGELALFLEWLSWLKKTDVWADEINLIEECRKTVEWLRAHESNVIVL